MGHRTDMDAREARDGSPEAFARLYERVSPALETWARIRVRGVMARHADPEDVVQEIWWRSLEAFPAFDRASVSFRAWIFGVANNVLREMLRRRTGQRDGGAARYAIDLEDLGPELRAQLTSITQQSRRTESVNKLASLVLALPEEDQRLFAHRGLEQMSGADVAAILGISENAVKKRWAKMRERLAELSIWRDFEEDA